jgi:hypothetical protein
VRIAARSHNVERWCEFVEWSDVVDASGLVNTVNVTALLSDTWKGRVRRVPWGDCRVESRFTEGGPV